MLIDWSRQRTIYSGMDAFLKGMGATMLNIDMLNNPSMNEYDVTVLFLMDGAVKQFVVHVNMQTGHYRFECAEGFGIFEPMKFLLESPEVAITPEIRNMIPLEDLSSLCHDIDKKPVLVDPNIIVFEYKDDINEPPEVKIDGSV